LQLLTVPDLRAALKALGLAAPSSACREQVVGVLRDALTSAHAVPQAEQVTCEPPNRHHGLQVTPTKCQPLLERMPDVSYLKTSQQPVSLGFT
jgi:hypothetical protein